MSVPIQYEGNTICMEAGATITKWAGLVTDTEGIVIMGATDNDAGFIGVAVEKAASGESVTIALPGSVVPMIVGATGITLKEYVTLHGASGRVTELGSTSGTAYDVVGMALEAGGTVGDEISVLVLNFRQRAEQ